MDTDRSITGAALVNAFGYPASGESEWTQHRRTALWLGIGLTGGLTLALMSPRQWSRLGALVFGGSAWLLRSPLGPAALAALLARLTVPVLTEAEAAEKRRIASGG